MGLKDSAHKELNSSRAKTRNVHFKIQNYTVPIHKVLSAKDFYARLKASSLAFDWPRLAEVARAPQKALGLFSHSRY